MIASKLILFFCFYLLLLDNSLGQKALITQVGNKKLFLNAMEFGQTYRGELGLLGSQWKQLLIQLVQAKRNVGLGKYQLSRFNESAMTEEVGLAITDSYADKVAELVAIRTQDVGATQKYIDDLEILKNEIALTMIVEMDEIEGKFKENNVREKVKEAKENGLTDTDIKEILFAEFIDSREGLSLIDGRASSPDALLSSFRKGMDRILGETYYKKLGIIQYIDSDRDDSINSFEYGVSYTGSDDGYFDDIYREMNNPYPYPEGAAGGAAGGAGGGGGPGRGGDGPDGPPDGPPSTTPSTTPGAEEDDNEEDDEEKVNSLNFFEEFRLGDVFTVERLEMALFRRTGEGEDEEETENRPRGPPQVSVNQQISALGVVDSSLSSDRTRIDNFRTEAATFARHGTTEFGLEARYRIAARDHWRLEDRLQIHSRRAEYYESLWRSAQVVYDEYLNFRHQFFLDYERTIQNFYYYGVHLGGNSLGLDEAHLPKFRPEGLAQFPPDVEDNETLYLISRTRLNALIDIGIILRNLYEEFRTSLLSFRYAWRQEQDDIELIFDDSLLRSM